MAFRLKKGAPVATEVRRIVLRQLEVAVSELHTVGDPQSDEAVHDARRRVKKIRAIIRLVRPVLDKAYRSVDDDLRTVAHMLAPVADGRGIIETLDELARRYGKALPPRTIEAARKGVIRHGARADREATERGILEVAAGTLRSERKRIKHWHMSAQGFRAIGPGLEESYRRARRMMIVAWSKPKPSHFHTWRRYVKDHWFHVRLLEGRCGYHLVGYERRIEALDGVLGEYHNVILLRDVLVTDVDLPREETALCLRVVARYQRLLRRHAELLGVRIYTERPRRFVRRIRRLWQQQTDGPSAGHPRAPYQQE
ncbi:MAG TPA: CHAD domain-containing protein [Vicinamibacterales bacterium]|nr:CHAD domain-containing protein [Vicinamibacterales bacterium]